VAVPRGTIRLKCCHRLNDCSALQRCCCVVATATFVDKGQYCWVLLGMLCRACCFFAGPVHGTSVRRFCQKERCLECVVSLDGGSTHPGYLLGCNHTLNAAGFVRSGCNNIPLLCTSCGYLSIYLSIHESTFAPSRAKAPQAASPLLLPYRSGAKY
jgi:hypothetical protein